MTDNHPPQRTSTAWLAALVTVLALVVPVSLVGAAPSTEPLDLAALQEDDGDEDPYTLEQESETATLDAVPESATNKVVEPESQTSKAPDEVPEWGHRFTATYTGPGGAPITTAATTERIIFKVLSGPTADTTDTIPGGEPGTIGSCDTDADGECSHRYASAEAGRDIVLVFVDKDGDGELDDGEPSDVLDKDWVAEEDEGEVDRLGGAERIATAIEISQATFPEDGSAGSVVLARADKFPDALTGTPLTAKVDAPTLLTYPDQLSELTGAEIDRLLDPGDTVYVLGEVEAISTEVENELIRRGYRVVRLGGRDRFETAVEIADRIEQMDAAGDGGADGAGVERAQADQPTSKVFITTGVKFPDALTAGAAAIAHNAVIVLSAGDATYQATTDYLDTRGDATFYAIGGPAARAYADRVADEFEVVGATRDETAVRVALLFFDDPPVMGLARRGAEGDDTDPSFADALTGGAHVGRVGGPMLITFEQQLSSATERYACYEAASIDQAFVYGETEAIAADVADALRDRIRGVDCPEFDDPLA